MRVRIAVICHAHGHDVMAAKTYAGLRRKLHAYVKENWGGPEPIPEDMDEAFEAHFSGAARESLTEMTADV